MELGCTSRCSHGVGLREQDKQVAEHYEAAVATEARADEANKSKI